MPQVRQDPGCLAHVPHRMIGCPDSFFAFEENEDEEVIAYHASTPHFLADPQMTAHLVRSREVGRWRLVV